MSRSPKYNKADLSDDSCGYVCIYPHHKNSQNTVNVHFSKEAGEKLNCTRVVFDRVNLTITPATTVDLKSFKLTKTGGRICFGCKLFGDRESLLGDYEMVEEQGIYKLYKVDAA